MKRTLQSGAGDEDRDVGGTAEGTGAGAGEWSERGAEMAPVSWADIAPGVSEAGCTDALKTGRVRGTISR